MVRRLFGWSLGRLLWPLVRLAGEPTRFSQRWHARRVASSIGVWIHAASLGELAPLADTIREIARSTGVGITVTSGRSFAGVQDRFGEFADVRLLPWPGSPGVDQLVAEWQPRHLTLIESEAWPHLLRAVRRRNMSWAILGGRLNAATRPFLRRHLVRHDSEKLHGIWTADQATADEYVQIGAPASKCTAGFLAKLAAGEPSPPSDEFSAWRQDGARHLVAGSFHPKDARTLVPVFTSILQDQTPTQILLVPRHPDRAAEVAAPLLAAGLPVATWPKTDPITLVPQFGVLQELYGLADVALVGGSWFPYGGHNPVEPLLHGVPVVMGTHYKNQATLLSFLPKNAVRTCEDPTVCADTIRAQSTLPPTQRQALKGAVGRLRKSAQDSVLTAMAP